MNLRRLGGLSALILAAAYVVGAVLNFTLLDTSSILDPVEKVAFLASKQTLFQVWIFFVYVVFGVCLVFLAEALLEQLRAPAGQAPRRAGAHRDRLRADLGRPPDRSRKCLHRGPEHRRRRLRPEPGAGGLCLARDRFGPPRTLRHGRDSGRLVDLAHQPGHTAGCALPEGAELPGHRDRRRGPAHGDPRRVHAGSRGLCARPLRLVDLARGALATQGFSGDAAQARQELTVAPQPQ